MTFAADTELYLAQARAMDSASDRLSSVLSAARSTDLDGGAFGRACGFLASSAQSAMNALSEAISQTRGVVDGTSVVLRDIATDFTATEDEHVAALNSLESKLP